MSNVIRLLSYSMHSAMNDGKIPAVFIQPYDMFFFSLKHPKESEPILNLRRSGFLGLFLEGKGHFISELTGLKFISFGSF